MFSKVREFGFRFTEQSQHHQHSQIIRGLQFSELVIVTDKRDCLLSISAVRRYLVCSFCCYVADG